MAQQGVQMDQDQQNVMLAEVVASLKMTGLQDVPHDHCCAEPGDVACDVCTGSRLKAVKTCLQCLVSYCDTHLQPHYRSPAFKKHKLVKASSERQNICSHQGKVSEFFCCTEEHKGHHTISAAAEDVSVLHQEVESINHFADRAVEDSDTILRDKLEDILTEEGTNVSDTVNRVDVLLSTPSEPKTRAEFLEYARPITLDPNTAHRLLSLSKGNRKVTLSGNKPHSYPDHPERFTGVGQVLSRETLTGRWYWEVKWSGGDVLIAVAYKDINRTGYGDECAFGFNDKSWALQCTNPMDPYHFFYHRCIKTDIELYENCRIGVYLDYSAGTLSFYRVSESDTMTLLHTAHATFTHNLHVGFNLYSAFSMEPVTAELCDLN